MCKNQLDVTYSTTTAWICLATAYEVTKEVFLDIKTPTRPFSMYDIEAFGECPLPATGDPPSTVPGAAPTEAVSHSIHTAHG